MRTRIDRTHNNHCDVQWNENTWKQIYNPLAKKSCPCVLNECVLLCGSYLSPVHRPSFNVAFIIKLIFSHSMCIALCVITNELNESIHFTGEMHHINGYSYRCSFSLSLALTLSRIPWMARGLKLFVKCDRDAVAQVECENIVDARDFIIIAIIILIHTSVQNAHHWWQQRWWWLWHRQRRGQ